MGNFILLTSNKVFMPTVSTQFSQKFPKLNTLTPAYTHVCAHTRAHTHQKPKKQMIKSPCTSTAAALKSRARGWGVVISMHSFILKWLARNALSPNLVTFVSKTADFLWLISTATPAAHLSSPLCPVYSPQLPSWLFSPCVWWAELLVPHIRCH